MLESYPELRSRDREEIEAAVVINAQGDWAEMPVGRPHGMFIANAARFDQPAALIFSEFADPIAFGFRPADYVRVFYHLRATSEVEIEGKVLENATTESGYLIPADARWQVRHATGFRTLGVRVGATTLRRKLAVLLDDGCAALDLHQPSAADPRRAELLRQSVFYFAREIEAADPAFLPSLAVSAIETISLRLLSCASGAMVERTRRPPPAPSIAELGRVEAYLVANFAEPLTMERLVEVSGASIRSIFAHFVSRYGCTPYGYLQQIRLDMARMMLSCSQDRNPAEAIAARCGFHSLRQFEHAYRNKFGVNALDGLRPAGAKTRRACATSTRGATHA